MPREGLQRLLIGFGVLAYPGALVALPDPLGYLVAPPASGVLIALFSYLGPDYYCPVKVGALAGFLGLAAYYAFEQALVIPAFQAFPGILAPALSAAYNLAAPSAMGGLAIIAFFRVGKRGGPEA